MKTLVLRPPTAVNAVLILACLILAALPLDDLIIRGTPKEYADSTHLYAVRLGAMLWRWGTILVIASVILRDRVWNKILLVEGVRGSFCSRASRADVAIGAVLGVAVLTIVLPEANGPLTYDELYTVVRFADAPWSHLAVKYFSSTNHQLTTASIKVAKAFGFSSPLSFRWLSLLGAVVTPGLLYVLLRRSLDRPSSVLGAASMILTTAFTHYATQARGYAVVAPLVLVSALTLVSSVQRGGRLRPIAFGVAATGAFLAHPLAALPIGLSILVFAVSAVARRRAPSDALRRLSTAVICAVALAIPVTAHFLPSFVGIVLPEAAEYSPSERLALLGLGQFLSSESAGPWAWTFAVLALAAAFMLSVRRVPLGGILIGAGIVPVAVCVGSGMAIWPRFLYPSLLVCLATTVAFLASGQGMRLFLPPKAARAAGAACAVALVLWPHLVSGGSDSRPAWDFEEAVASVRGTIQRNQDAPLYLVGGASCLLRHWLPSASSLDFPSAEKVIGQRKAVVVLSPNSSSVSDRMEFDRYCRELAEEGVEFQVVGDVDRHRAFVVVTCRP